MLNFVIKSENEYKDLIKGKSRGKIIISTGEPGLGKTLTAEVYAEFMERPLYKIQASQLGIEINNIESKLQTVLYNAYRWKVILLIDEADVFIRKRGNDIVQNAIVAIFLRLLEYYEGVLFLTSNKDEDIDEAVLSRSTLYFKYTYPNKEDCLKIFDILFKENNQIYDKKEIEKIIQLISNDDKGEFKLSGRSIGIIVKNLISYSKHKEQKISVELFKQFKNYIYI